MVLNDIDTIAAISGGMGGAIGKIRVSGNDAIEICDRIFLFGKDYNSLKEAKEDSVFNKISDVKNEKLSEKSSHTIHYGFIFDSENNEIIDEVLVLLMKAPGTYTREDIVEIDTHANALCQKKILKLLLKNGARAADPGEFTKRAFLNGRVNLSEAESVMDIISSENDFALKNSMDHLNGKFGKIVFKIRKTILDDMSFIEAGLDDPEHIDIDGFRDELLQHIDTNLDILKKFAENFDDGKILSQGINTAIVGKPNVGKSSLLNMMLDFERAIVTEIPGTTRDLIQEKVKVGPLVLNLIDTAGIRTTKDHVEFIGVQRAIDQGKNADLVLYVLDSPKLIEKLDQDGFDFGNTDKENYSKFIGILNDEGIVNFDTKSFGSATDENTANASTDGALSALDASDKTGIILLNKYDKIEEKYIKKFEKFIDKFAADVIENDNNFKWNLVLISAKKGHGVEKLKDIIISKFYNSEILLNNEVYITSDRHYNVVLKVIESLNKAKETILDEMPEDLILIDMLDAINLLGLINGETATEDLVDNIFKNFCMGK